MTLQRSTTSYKKITQLEHVLLRADMYVGSKELEKCEMYIPIKEGDGPCHMILTEVSFIPAFVKIFDEILVNAADNSVRDLSTDTIKVNVDAEKGFISVFNNGKGIPVQIHEKEKIYIPEMIFGHLLTSSNFDDDEKKVTGGRNGFGAKLTNIYSTEFHIETHDCQSGLTYKQKWTGNMSNCSAPKITKASKKKDFTEIRFKPDLEKLNMTSFDVDTISVLRKRVYDLTGSLRKVKVFYNNERVSVNSFKEYISLYFPSTIDPNIVYDKPNDRWEVGVAISDSGSFKQVSFVNSIATIKGGTHVNHVVDQIVSNLIDLIKKKDKSLNPKPAQVKSSLFVFVNCLIENPIFTGQTKEVMTLAVSKFGSSCTLSENFMRKVQKLGIVESTMNLLQQKELKELKKTDGSKRTRVDGILKLSDANDAGTRKSSSCTLFICEGDSAKSFAVTGIPVIKNGQDLYGVYPLKGKLLNVRDASTKEILGNKEMNELKQVLGLQEGRVYNDVKSLRYGHICCLVDSDLDGHHIKGLILNWLDASFPSLLKIPGFVLDFVSPIVKCSKGKEEVFHYTLKDYETWKTKTKDSSSYVVKYFKGLGTSKPSDTKRYFNALGKHLKRFREAQDDDRESIDMAFAKKRVHDRKDWLKAYNPIERTDEQISNSLNIITIKDFVNRDLIEFSMYDNVRSIPSVVDGLKPGQRKILFTAFKTKLTSDIKVAQLAAEVSKTTEYRHGEQSLCETIVGMAQDFCGTNNIALLAPEGAFGTRLKGGKDAGAPRYIYTKLAPVTRRLFPIDDDQILHYLIEDGFSIEPRYYVPIIPLVLVNGAKGIGFGYSTTVLSHDPKKIIECIIQKTRDPNYKFGQLQPWYKGFTGKIVPCADGKYSVLGRASFLDKTTVEITELPVGTWTDSYKQNLETWLNELYIKDYKEYHTDTIVKFVVKLTDLGLARFTTIIDGLDDEGSLNKNLKLTTTLHSSNMMLFSPEGTLKNYETTADILEDFYQTRLKYYADRKEHLIKTIFSKISVVKNKTKFITGILNETIVLKNRKKSDIQKDLKKLGFTPNAGSDDGYSYLLEMSLYSLTSERIAELENTLASLKATFDDITKKSLEETYRHELEELYKIL